jgi:hypothetical protein
MPPLIEKTDFVLAGGVIVTVTPKASTYPMDVVYIYSCSCIEERPCQHMKLQRQELERIEQINHKSRFRHTRSAQWEEPFHRELDNSFFTVDEEYVNPNLEPPAVTPTFSMPKPTWKTRDGRVVEIQEMEDSHLVNAIRLIEGGRFGKWRRSSLSALKAEQVRRGIERVVDDVNQQVIAQEPPPPPKPRRRIRGVSNE